MVSWLSDSVRSVAGLGSRAATKINNTAFLRIVQLAALLLLALTTGSLVAPANTALASPNDGVYWTEFVPGTIRRADFDGSGAQALPITALGLPIDVAVDPAGEKIYWTESDGDVRRANLDGSGAETLLTDTPDIRGVAVDPVGGKVYWTSVGSSNKISRADVDGSNPEDLVTGVVSSGSVALDVANGKMYWSEEIAGKIRRANLDGTSVEDRLTGLSAPAGIAVDSDGGKIYWIENGPQKIRRANLDGSGQEDLITDIETAVHIALDLSGGMMYWTELGPELVRRADLSGSSAEVLYTAPQNVIPWGIAVHSSSKLPEPGDTDGDGCSDQRENGLDETLGGLRDFENPYDFYDVLGPGAALPEDGVVDLANDILGVIQHFAPLGTEPEYDVHFDRGPQIGANVWNMGSPDGVIDLANDILSVILQFNHSCAQG